jgi:hypothetical protein
MAESLIIDFAPQAHRYHYDALRVLCDDGETLLIPIHAYPIMNKVVRLEAPLKGAETLLGETRRTTGASRVWHPCDTALQECCMLTTQHDTA